MGRGSSVIFGKLRPQAAGVIGAVAVQTGGVTEGSPGGHKCLGPEPSLSKGLDLCLPVAMAGEQSQTARAQYWEQEGICQTPLWNRSHLPSLGKEKKSVSDLF